MNKSNFRDPYGGELDEDYFALLKVCIEKSDLYMHDEMYLSWS